MKNLSTSDVEARDEVVRLIKSGEPIDIALNKIINQCTDGGRRAHLWVVLPGAVRDASKKTPRGKRPTLQIVGLLDTPINPNTVVTPRMLKESKAVEILHNNGEEIMEEFLSGDIDLLNEISIDGEFH